MRTTETIKAEFHKAHERESTWGYRAIVLEVLLDIRDLCIDLWSKSNPTVSEK